MNLYAEPRRKTLGYGIALHSAVIMILMIVLAPVAWTVLSAFKPQSELFVTPPSLFPVAPTLENFLYVWNGFPFPIWFLNSIVITIVATAGAVLISAMGGFAFAKYDFFGKRFLFSWVVAALVVPGIVMIVPLFVMFAKVGLVNSYFAVILPMLAQPFGIFMMRQFITQTIQTELLDAARLDGANEFRIFWTMVLPLTKPAVAALSIFLGLSIYNNLLWPLVIMTSPERQTLPVGLAAMASSFYVNEVTVLAAGVLGAIPSVIIFVVLRKQFIAGLTAGSVAN